MTALLSTSYFPNIEYISNFLKYSKVVIEANENYIKKTYRNRCDILSANGVITLSVPVINNKKAKTKISDIQISYVENWQKIHLNALESAYRSSPFYEFYIDDFVRFFNTEFDNLFDFNTQITKLILQTIGVKTEIEFTSEFIDINNKYEDYRFSISKNKSPNIDKDSYIQVFADKFKFEQNLSALDLIFNLGPESILYLKNII